MERALKILLGFCSYLLAWLLLALILTAQQTYGGAPWAASLLVSLKYIMPWVLASPFIILSSYWFPVFYGRWWLSTVLHVTLCMIILVGVARIREMMATQWPDMNIQETRIRTSPLAGSKMDDEKTDSGAAKSTQVEMIQQVSQTAPLGVPLYVTIVFLFSLSRYRREISQRDQTALKLKSQLTQTQLDLLRSQLQPHFLFNTLNSISALIYSDRDKADSMVIKLSSLLRRTLDQRDETLISLEREIVTLKAYLEIQSMRFGERMEIKFMIGEDALKQLVPPMILLPLVENAIRYGVEKSCGLTTIKIASSICDGQLTLAVSDDGPGLDPANESGTGVGLANIQSRLEVVYPKKVAGVTLIEQQGGGVTATIEFPIST